MGKVTLILLFPLLLACSLWMPYAAMQAPQPTPTPTQYVLSSTPNPTPQSVTRDRVDNVKVCHVTAESLNVRSCGSVHCPVVDWLYLGDLLTITTQRDGWAQVETTSGESGWINLAYCEG